MSAGHDQRVHFPLHYAFVVQFAADTPMQAGQIRGRVEHVVSRHATHFESLETLLAFVIRLLHAKRQTAEPTQPLRRWGTREEGGEAY